MWRTLHGVNVRRDLTGLVLEEIHRVAGVVPQQVVGPAPGLAEGVRVRATEEERLAHQMLKAKLPGLDPVVHPLVARVEAPDMVRHRHQAGFALHLGHPFRTRERVGHRDLDQHVLAGAHRLLGLVGVDRSRRREDGRFDSRLRQGVRKIRRPVRNAVPGGRRLRVLGHAARNGHDVHTVDSCQRIQMLVGKGPFTDHADLHESVRPRSSSTISP